jgi:hypothetical protein
VPDLAQRLAARTLELIDIPSESRGEAPLATQEWLASDFGEPVPGTTSTYDLIVPESSKFEARFVHLEARFTAPSSGSGQGWSLDDVAVWNAGQE